MEKLIKTAMQLPPYNVPFIGIFKSDSFKLNGRTYQAIAFRSSTDIHGDHFEILKRLHETERELKGYDDSPDDHFLPELLVWSPINWIDKKYQDEFKKEINPTPETKKRDE